MSRSRNIVFHRKSDFQPTRKRVGFTPQFITIPLLLYVSKLLLNYVVEALLLFFNFSLAKYEVSNLNEEASVNDVVVHGIP